MGIDLRDTDVGEKKEAKSEELQGEIPKQLQEMQQSFDLLEDELYGLEQKLTGILRSTDERQGSELQLQGLTRLGYEIGTGVGRIQQCIEKLKEIQDRCEL